MATWLLLVQVCVVAAVTYTEDKYEVDQSMGEFGHLVIEKGTGRIFVGATNTLYEFDRNLKRINEITTGPKPDNPECIFLYSEQSQCKVKKSTNSYSKGLVIDYDHNHLIACSSLFHGYCEKYYLDDITQKEQTSYWPVVANNDSASTFIFIGPGPVEDQNGHEGTVLYVGATRVANNPVSRDRLVPSFCSRKLEGDPKLVHKDVATSTKIQIDTLQRGTFPIHYIYGFNSDLFTYMITVQKESPGAENYITKILRVCNRDENFYSYTEVQLICKHKDKLYNLSQAAFLGEAGIRLARNFGAGKEYLYVVFSSGNVNSWKPNPDSSSALCIYPMYTIKSIFTRNIQACFNGYGNTGPAHVIMPSKCLKTVSIKSTYSLIKMATVNVLNFQTLLLFCSQK